MSETRETCETCRFWDRKAGNVGACKRKSPRIFVFSSAHTDDIQYQTHWPYTDIIEAACGEHAPAKKETP